jgi:hypothetical protein
LFNPINKKTKNKTIFELSLRTSPFLLISTNNDKIFLYFFDPFFFTKSLQATPKAWVQKPFSSLDFMILCCLWVIPTPMLPIISAETNRM